MPLQNIVGYLPFFFVETLCEVLSGGSVFANTKLRGKLRAPVFLCKPMKTRAHTYVHDLKRGVLGEACVGTAFQRLRPATAGPARFGQLQPAGSGCSSS